MASIDWQDAPSKSSAHHTSSTAMPPVVSSPALGGSNPWFGASMALLGLIVGFGIGTVMKGSGPFARIPSPQVAQAPSAPIQAPQPPPAAGPLPTIDPKIDHIRGDLSKAQVAVVEYSDMECPFCQRVHATYKQIMETYGDRVVWVYRHFPLSFHANAQKEAEASDCAAELGGNDAFWKYTDAIFERSTVGGTGFPLDNLVPMAKEFGLDEAKFKNCLESGKYAQHVKDEMSAGTQAGVNGTPGNFIVNLKTQKSQLLSGAQPLESFKTAIDAMLK